MSGRVRPVLENRRRIHYEYDVGGFARQFRVGDAIEEGGAVSL